MHKNSFSQGTRSVHILVSIGVPGRVKSFAKMRKKEKLQKYSSPCNAGRLQTELIQNNKFL